MSTLLDPRNGRLEVLGVDFGGVINSSSSEFFHNNPEDVLPMPGALETLNRLARERFGGNIWVVSTAGAIKQVKTLRWFKHYDAYRQACVIPEQVVFCTRQFQKAELCRELGITHFIDDKISILIALDPQVIKYLFRPDDNDRRRQRMQFPDSIIPIESWEEVGELFLSS